MDGRKPTEHRSVGHVSAMFQGQQTVLAEEISKFHAQVTPNGEITARAQQQIRQALGLDGDLITLPNVWNVTSAPGRLTVPEKGLQELQSQEGRARQVIMETASDGTTGAFLRYLPVSDDDPKQVPGFRRLGPFLNCSTRLRTRFKTEDWQPWLWVEQGGHVPGHGPECRDGRHGSVHPAGLHHQHEERDGGSDAIPVLDPESSGDILTRRKHKQLQDSPRPSYHRKTRRSDGRPSTAPRGGERTNRTQPARKRPSYPPKSRESARSSRPDKGADSTLLDRKTHKKGAATTTRDADAGGS